MRYKEIITITGPSGAGKSMLEEFLSEGYGYQPIHSMTTRAQRDDKDVHHRFVEPDFFTKQDPKKIICHDRFDKVNEQTGEKIKVEYGVFVKDFGARSVYVVEENGLVELFKRMSREFDIHAFYIDRPKHMRIAAVGVERVARDVGRLVLPDKVYDLIIDNKTNDKEDVYERVKDYMSNLHI